MEDYNKKKLGAGILTVSIIQLIFYVIGVLGLLFDLIALNTNILPESFSESMKTIANNSNGTFSNTVLYVGLIFSLIFIVSLIFILYKKSLGIYIYFLAVVINYISSIIMDGFSILGLFGLILPILMGIFIYRRRYVFNIGTKCAND